MAVLAVDAPYPRLVLHNDATWLCMACGAHDRPFDAISVVHRPLTGWPEQSVNVSYCNDRSECVAAVAAATSWAVGAPPPVQR